MDCETHKNVCKRFCSIMDESVGTTIFAIYVWHISYSTNVDFHEQ